MKIAGIDFPRPLLDALRDGKLVIFAGTGVSMGEPANLPNFRNLAMAVAQGTGEKLGEHETEDRFLGRLRQKGVDVHERVKEELSKNDPKPTDLHRDLLRLYSVPRQIRVVTTNFDLLFEQAAEDVFDLNPEVFRAPALPLGRDFDGIVHVHGAVSHPADMVLTDADFGRAYLTEGWARRFLLDLFRSFTVLFVGYSHNDTILNYLARALPASETGGRFALTDETDADRWQLLGIEPITYPPSTDHKNLYNGVQGLANYAARGILDWQREITDLAGKRPSLNEEEMGLIEEALSDVVKTRFFIKAASSPEWVDWLDERKHLDGLFGVGELCERDKLLAWWLAKKFVSENAEALFLLIGRHDMRIHPEFWDQLGGKVALQKDPPLNAESLSRWVSLLLTTTPAHPDEHILLWMGERCIEAELMDSLIEIFMACAAIRLEIKPGFNLYEDNTDDSKPSIRVELLSTSSYWESNELWEKGLKPYLDRVAEPLLARVVEELAAQHRRLVAWQEATRDYDPLSFCRSAIEPHEQDEVREPISIFVDVGRDCLEWLVSNRPEAAVRWCKPLVGSDAPLMRRLAVHTLFKRQDLSPNEKIDWLLTHINLHDTPAHHEVFMFLKRTYPEADSKRRGAIIEAVCTFRWPIKEEGDEEELAAYHHFRLLHWLHRADQGCPFAKKALDDVLKRYPDFKPHEHPDLLSWHRKVIGSQSPWSIKELLSLPAEEWVSKLLSFQETDLSRFDGPDRRGLVRAVEDAANQNFEWSIALADELARLGEWDSDLWPPLLRSWSNELTEDEHRNVFRRLSRGELYEEYARLVADVLYAFVRNGDASYAPDFLSKANEVAMTLWEHLDRDESAENSSDWHNQAIVHPGGVLAQFWLGSFSLWRKHQDPKPDALRGVYLNALSGIVQDESLAGRLGRSVLAREISFLLAVDEKWTKENLLPLFKAHDNVGDYQAIWDGFRYVSLSPSVAELMKDAFLEAVSHIKGDIFDGIRRAKFIEAYISMLVYFVDDPIKDWIPKFFDHSDGESRSHFASRIHQLLREMNEEKQQALWKRWLKRYWQNRLKGIPKPLNTGEIERMLNWLPYLESDVFPEAVVLAVRMPKESMQRGLSIHKINHSDLWRRYPEAVAKLLIHLGGCESPPYAWYMGNELIDKLIESDIPESLKEKLKELCVTLGFE